jgi:dTDP-4-amino-4,6-dideoxygalactose transaminase
MLPYGRHSVDESDVEAVVAALRSDWLTTGPQVDAFESDLAGWTGGVPCVAVSSGTAALHTAYAAAGVGPGDEVITPPITFVASAATAVALGARVSFVDVEDETANLDPDAAGAALTRRTRVITAVDYAGHPAEYDDLRKVATIGGALLVADAAHSLGARYGGVPVGALADQTTFTFFPTKNIATAEGGAVAARDPALLAAARRFRNHGLVRDPGELREPDEGGWHQEVHTFGLNYRLPDVLCALGRSQLRRLARFAARRAELFDRYRVGLADVAGIRLPTRRSWVDPVWHLFPLRVLDGRRREVYDRLRAAGIGVQVNFIPAYWHPVFADLGYRRGMCPVAERFYAEELSLPMFVELSDGDQDRAIDQIRQIFV